MSKVTERQLERVKELRALLAADADDRSGAIAELDKLLGSRSGYVGSRAAVAIAEAGLAELAPRLAEEFTRRLEEPLKRDPNCVTKLAIIEAMMALDEAGTPADQDVLLTGIRHVQMEPVFGGKVDTAIELRAACANGLVAIGYGGILFELARLLADPEPGARVQAARAIAASGAYGAEALLVHKTLCGDDESEVIYQTAAGLLQIAPDRGLAIAEELVASGDAEVAGQVAHALGASRLEAAFDVLTQALEERSELEAPVLAGLSAMRREEALAFLLGQIESGSSRRASLALEALAIHRHNEDLCARVGDAIDARGDRELARRQRALFSP